ncbi:Gx transporter family protein [Floccifex sp.]|uniref:Gx transporter family protein n=1 Tax=Floccifex sp. TaxID=2815810 RepID=UPI002A74D4A6|nr:Gx transporter family protein [Floccifex sp.]MDD7280982.1 Gx transporter family protein [Erysipelotrichaceae bacterium]MDY2958944.1 Gx transporter family protein [Floccifex sp.]
MKKTVYLSFLVAVGIVFQILESFLSVVWIIPGFKIGFANVVGIFSLYVWGPKEMCIVTLLRIFLASLMQGTLFSVSFWLSLSGGIFSMAIMTLAYKTKKFSIYGVSIAGACFHNIGQVIAVCIIYQQFFMQLFLPFLLALSNVSGICIGYLSLQIIKRVKGRIQNVNLSI